MSDWNFLNKNRRGFGTFGSRPEDGFNGLFEFQLPDEPRRIRVIASDGEGWQHVSVSFGANVEKTPSWKTMCAIKDLFFDPEDTVIQFHPAKSANVNNHPGCLHLWRCTDGREQPMPSQWLVGIPGASEADIKKLINK